MTQQDNPQTPETVPEPQQEPAAPEAEILEPAGPSAREIELEAEVAKLKDAVLRGAAETENVRRRLEQQAEDRGKYAVSKFAEDMLQVADNLRRALDSLPKEGRENDPLAHKLAEGVELTERGLLAAFERYAVKRIESVGQRFDPNFHQAMMEVDDATKPSGTVVLEMQAGYTIAERLLRPAMVGVSKGGPKPTAGDAAVDTSV